MARTLTASVTTATQDTITKPRYLAEIVWSSTVRVCSRETVMWGGYTWSGDLVSITGIEGKNSQRSATLVLPNFDNAYGTIALTEGLNDKPVSIYALYGDSPFAADDAVLLFSGSTDGGEIDTTRVVINCVDLRGETMFAPRIYLQPPLCNHLPPAGTTLRWGGDTYLLERR